MQMIFNEIQLKKGFKLANICSGCNVLIIIKGILPKGPYRPCVSMAGRALLAGGYPCIMMTSQWARWRLESPASQLFTQLFIQTQIKENIKATRHWPLCGNSPRTGACPTQMASNVENVSIWWRHHGICVWIQVTACCLFGAIPLPKPMMSYCYLDPWDQTFMQL